MNEALFKPLVLGQLNLPNRVVMAPMTRSRAGAGDVPNALNAEYYAQRSSAGLIVSEGTQPSINGKGYPRTPGIHSPEQISGWKGVTDAVHACGGRIFLQIMHAGRVAHPLNMSPDAEIVAPSAVPAQTLVFTDQQGPLSPPTPRALDAEEIKDLVGEFRRATHNALEAGCDGVELHAGSGYLPMQFLSPNANQRTDHYGGSVANRCRFVLELLEAMSEPGGSSKVGIKIAPGITFNDVLDPEAAASYGYLLDQLNGIDLAYVNVQRAARFLAEAMPGTDFSEDWLGFARERYAGELIGGGDYDAYSACSAIENGGIDMVAFGRHFLANPDLPRRLKLGAALNASDPNTFYTPGSEGYTDYPVLGVPEHLTDEAK